MNWFEKIVEGKLVHLRALSERCVALNVATRPLQILEEAANILLKKTGD